ncbi:hypothetical protein PF004_g3648 [Phytophthora fragariae]|uniref:Uncharacterized protein n=1 Tax=Phytophthora fragariae TaxID=53985 RepID=A0A6G0PKX5_9STRA|nr:hypothetical protein PF004_g3648 [Phytophthora fragariae]
MSTQRACVRFPPFRHLATKRYWAEREGFIEAVVALVAALRIPKNRAELRRHTPRAPLRANASRWSLIVVVLERYFRICAAIKREDTVDDLVPKPAVHRRVVAHVKNLKTFNSVYKKFQEDTISMSVVRVLFSQTTDIYSVMEDYLLPDAHIKHSSVFDSLTAAPVGSYGEELELEALDPFKLAAAAEPTPAPHGSGVSTRSRITAKNFAAALVCSDEAMSPLPPSYSPIAAGIPPTSNLCERLFSQCNLVMAPQ